MAKIKLGTNLTVDAKKLLVSRMLIQANSGGGKSYAERKLIEELYGNGQIIVIDPEGEFSTLREKFDFVLAGKNGDVEANPRTAELLARKLLELEVSAIIDLYELKPKERVRFVKLFLNSMVNAPKELWHPCFIVLDEAHVFAPEKGEAESFEAVTDMATRGRKRGFCLIPATQRLAKLHKDVAAECLNKLIGRTSLDIDRKRASDELGFRSAEESIGLRKLNPGEFYAYGPAISGDVIKGVVGRVRTTHPEAGQKIGFRKTKPTAKIKAVLKKLDDLPKEAAEELTTVAALRARINELEKGMRDLQAPTKKDPWNDAKAVHAAIESSREAGAAEIEKKYRDFAIDVRELLRSLRSKFEASLEVLTDAEKRIQKSGKKLFTASVAPTSKDFRVAAMIANDFGGSKMVTKELVAVVKPTFKVDYGKAEAKIMAEEAGKLGACERAIMGFLAHKPTSTLSKTQVSTWIGYSQTSSSFNNALSKLNSLGLIQRASDGIRLAPGVSPEPYLPWGSDYSLDAWSSKLGACERAIFEELKDNPDAVCLKEDLASVIGYSPTSSSFNNALSKLNTLGLIKRRADKQIQFNPEIVNL